MFHSLTRVCVDRETAPLPLISVLPSSNPVACRPGPDRRRLTSLRPSRLGKRDAAYPAGHAPRHSDRGCRRLDATTGRSTRYPPRRCKRAANQTINIRGDEKPRMFAAPLPPSLPPSACFLSPNLTHHPHVCATAPRPHVGSALDRFPFGTGWASPLSPHHRRLFHPPSRYTSTVPSTGRP